MQWNCEECGARNATEPSHGFLACPKCHQTYLLESDAPLPKKTAEEWLGTISRQLEVLNQKLEDAEEFRAKEKKVLSEIELILRKAR